MIKKVIIIDDSSTALNLLKAAFENCFWEVYVAKTAVVAYDLIFKVAPDLIVTDAIMPVVGGFQLVKTIRKNEKISKIPVIVYSVLPEKNAKFYIKEDSIEYFLSKDDNYDELIKLAEEITKKYPLDEAYKEEILKEISNNEENTIEDVIQEPEVDEVIEEEKEPEINFELLESEIKENCDYSLEDKKLFSDLFKVMYPYLDYDLMIVFPYFSEENKKFVYFDIKDIIISRFFQSYILNKLAADDVVLFKKYAPNLNTILKEEEFLSKLEFSFEYKGAKTVYVAFYSKKANKWQNEDNIESIKRVLEKLFKNRYIDKFLKHNKKDGISNKYYSNKSDLDIYNKFETEEKNSYVGILDITNFSDLKANLSVEELDIINSRISQKIINYIDKDEYVFKNDEDEYIVLIYAKNENRAAYKFNCIIRLLDEISYNNYHIESVVGASCCIIDKVFNIREAQKTARVALEFTSASDRVVVQ